MDKARSVHRPRIVAADRFAPLRRQVPPTPFPRQSVQPARLGLPAWRLGEWPLPVQAAGVSSPLFWVGAILICIWGLITILPSLGLLIRRLHDIGQSGWLSLVIIILLVIPGISLAGTIAIIVAGCIKGQPGENKYGPPVT